MIDPCDVSARNWDRSSLESMQIVFSVKQRGTIVDAPIQDLSSGGKATIDPIRVGELIVVERIGIETHASMLIGPHQVNPIGRSRDGLWC
jgi:hypothetical protein